MLRDALDVEGVPALGMAPPVPARGVEADGAREAGGPFVPNKMASQHERGLQNGVGVAVVERGPRAAAVADRAQRAQDHAVQFGPEEARAAAGGLPVNGGEGVLRGVQEGDGFRETVQVVAADGLPRQPVPHELTEVVEEGLHAGVDHHGVDMVLGFWGFVLYANDVNSVAKST